jgi:hypothetical protein
MKSKYQDEIVQLIDAELINCSDDVYPELCQLKSTSMGKEKIYAMTIKIIAESGMSIGSALAQLESSF